MRDRVSYYYEWREFGKDDKVVDKLPVSQTMKAARIRFYGMLVDEMGLYHRAELALWENALVTALKDKSSWSLLDGRGANWKLMKLSLNMVEIGWVEGLDPAEETVNA
jgi:hypothetical protein